MLWLDVLLYLISVPLLVCAGYLFAFSVLARRPRGVSVGSTTPYFAVCVPAHDEELNVASTVQSLLAVEYARDRFEVVVIADNCSDATAERAKGAGARVLVRNDPSRRGKGYALEYAFQTLLNEAKADALVVVDADTSVSKNLLQAFALRLDAGAQAVQAHYAVRNPLASWRTRLMSLALVLFHGVRSLARERLQVSVGLRGNGMAFSRQVLLQVPHEAFSIVEDVEYGIRLGIAGHRVHYAGEAEVFGEMVAGERESRSQRERWETGRRKLSRELGPKLLLRGLRERSLLLIDLAMDILIPPLATLTVAIWLGTLVSLGAVLLLHRPPAVALPWLFAAVMLVFYVLRGVALSGLGVQGLVTLFWAPVYVAWKILLRLRRSGARANEWVRTSRGERSA